MVVQPEVIGYINKGSLKDRHVWLTPTLTPFCTTPVVVIPEGCVVVSKQKLEKLLGDLGRRRTVTDIFVFGSSLAGRHGRGAARDALKKHGAMYGKGIGRQGSSYAIPTKNYDLKPLPLWAIKGHIENFIEYAEAHKQYAFHITRVGCGLAGYNWEKDIRPLFPAVMPANCFFLEYKEAI